MTKYLFKSGDENVAKRPDIRAKIGLSKIGNKNCLGKICSEETKKKIGDSQRGIKSSHFGKHLLKETKEKISMAMKGRETSEEHRRNLSKALTGKHLSEETKSKLREYSVNNPNRKFRDTGIELRVEAELQKRGINYQKQVPLCKVAIVDFYLPEYRIIIQCDGDYWHNRNGSKERDLRQDAVLTFNGFNVYRFWEHEINESVENCINGIRLWLTEQTNF